MNIIIQQEKTGCGIAAVANIVGLSYGKVKTVANAMGIFAEDKTLFSDTAYVRKLLAYYEIQTHKQELDFYSWDKLPNVALLAIKYHQENNKFFWHWVVFKSNSNSKAVVLDSATNLKCNSRTDFYNMQPKWYIEVYKNI